MSDIRPAAALLVAFAAPAVAGDPVITTSFGIDFVTVGDPGNAPWDSGIVFNPPRNDGRGSVGYEYRIARTEIATGQWLEFSNIFASIPDSPYDFSNVQRWGATPLIGTTLDTLSPFFPDAANHPVYGITWREAAMYCNWLHNDKAPEVSALLDGAYDVSTFGFEQFFGFTDQLTRNPDARYWIPSLDEWIKAAHYDPDRYGEGEGGYWEYSHSSDSPPIPGLPGVGQTTAGIWDGTEFEVPDVLFQDAVFATPVGSYADVMSPWGLWDTSGGASEWTEEFPIRNGRVVEGTFPGIEFDLLNLDSIGQRTSRAPVFASSEGLRIASHAVPAPGAALLLLCGGSILGSRRRRHHDTPTHSHRARIRTHRGDRAG